MNVFGDKHALCRWKFFSSACKLNILIYRRENRTLKHSQRVWCSPSKLDNIYPPKCSLPHPIKCQTGLRGRRAAALFVGILSLACQLMELCLDCSLAAQCGVPSLSAGIKIKETPLLVSCSSRADSELCFVE